MVYIEWGQGLKTRFRSQPGFCPNSGANCNEFTMNTTVGQKTLPGVSSSSSSRRLHPVHRLEVDYWQRKRSRRPYFLLQVNRQQSPGKDSEEDYHAALVIIPRCKALGKIFKFGNKEVTPHLGYHLYLQLLMYGLSNHRGFDESSIRLITSTFKRNERFCRSLPSGWSLLNSFIDTILLLRYSFNASCQVEHRSFFVDRFGSFLYISLIARKSFI